MTRARTPTSDTHRSRLRAAFARLRRQGFVAAGPLGPTPSDGWTEVYDRSGDEEAPAVFWTDGSDRAFDGSGTLKRRLPLQWRGDAKTIEAHLAAEGLAVEGALDARDTIVVLPKRLGARTKPPPPAAPKSTAKKKAGGGSALTALLDGIRAVLATLETAGWKVDYLRQHDYEPIRARRLVMDAAAKKMLATGARIESDAMLIRVPRKSWAELRRAFAKQGVVTEGAEASDGLVIMLPKK